MEEKNDERFEKWLAGHTSADFAPKKHSSEEELSEDDALSSSAGIDENTEGGEETSAILEEIPERTFLLNDYYFENEDEEESKEPDFAVYTPLVSDTSGKVDDDEPIRRKVRDPQYVISDGDDGVITSDTGREFLDMNSFSIPELVGENNNQASKNASKSARREHKLEKRRNKQKRKKNRWLFRVTWIVLVAMLGIYAGSYLSKGASDVFAMHRAVDATVDITIPEEAGLDEVVQILSEANVIDQPQFFKLYLSA